MEAGLVGRAEYDELRDVITTVRAEEGRRRTGRRRMFYCGSHHITSILKSANPGNGHQRHSRTAIPRARTFNALRTCGRGEGAKRRGENWRKRDNYSATPQNAPITPRVHCAARYVGDAVEAVEAFRIATTQNLPTNR